MKTIAHAEEKPQEIQYTACADGLADVWLRKNIEQQTCSSGPNDAKNLEYVYDEVFFRTSDVQEAIETDFDTYWDNGELWTPEVPPTKEEQDELRIKELETALEQSRLENDMAIAELTTLLATAVSVAE